MIAENDWRDAAAVASRRAGELYGLNVLDEDIQVRLLFWFTTDFWAGAL